MSRDAPLVELFQDGHSCFGTTLVFDVSPYMVKFAIHEIITEPPEYEIYGWEQSGDWTDDLGCACPQVHGEIKFDGCSHVYFGNAEKPGEATCGGLHLCGESRWKWIAACMERVFSRAREILRAEGKWLEKP